MNGGARPETDPILNRLRRGDFGTTPFAQIQEHPATQFGPRWTTAAIRSLRAGAGAERIGRRHGENELSAELYRVAHEGQSLCLLIVARGDALMDIAAGLHIPAELSMPVHPVARALTAVHGLFFGVSLADMHRNVGTFRLAAPWTSAAMAAIDLSVRAAWPQRDEGAGFSSGGRLGSKAFYAVKATQAEWQKLDGPRKAHVLAAVGSAARRVYGLLQPDCSASEITVGIQAAEPQATDRHLVFSLTPREYLARETVIVRAWRSAPTPWPGAA